MSAIPNSSFKLPTSPKGGIASRVLTLPTYYGLPLDDVEAVHRQQLEHRMAGDTDEQAEKEEAVFTSGAVIGSESFVTKIVKSEEEAFPAGHKTPPVNFGIGGVVLKTLRNLKILR